MKCILKTLTPLHIGNGEELNALDYIVHGNKFYRITQKQFLEFLLKQGIDVSLYAGWITKTTNQIESLEKERKTNYKNFGRDKNQLLSDIQNSFNLMAFSKEVKKQNEFSAYLQLLHGIHVSSQIKQKVRGFIKTANNKPYIPGTSIKGAIRTALLYNFLVHNADKNNINRILSDSLRKIDTRNLDKSKKDFADEIEQYAFYCGIQKENSNPKFTDEKYDIFKFLSITDGKITTKNALSLENIDLYLISKDRKGNRKADRQGQTPTIEALSEGIEIEFELDFNIDYLRTVKNNLNENGNIEVKYGKDTEKQWIDIKEKIKNIFCIDISELNLQLKEDFRKKVLENILSGIKTFSKKQIEWDKKWVDNFIQNDADNRFSAIKNGFNKITSDNVFHLGFGSGFTGITEVLFLLDNLELKALFKKIMEIFMIGRPGAQKNRNQGESYIANPDKFPKSKRLITRKDCILPLGWTEFITEEHSEKSKVQDMQISAQRRLTNELEVKKKDEEKRKAEEEARQKAEDAKKPQYFTGKLKDGVGPIDAIVVKPGNPNYVKLFIPEKEVTVEMRGTSEILAINAIVKVKINQITNKSEIKQVGFIGKK